MPRTEVSGRQIRDASVALSAADSPTGTADVTGVLPVDNGGTGVATLTGLVKSNGTLAFSAAVAGTDYVTPNGTETLTNKTVQSATLSNFTTLSGTLQSFNTADGVNYERGRISWNSNAFTVTTDVGGTGTPRDVVISSVFSSTTSSLLIRPGGSFAKLFLNGSSSAATGGVVRVHGTLNASTPGNQFGLHIEPTINQSGSASYTALLVNPTVTATGSGTKRLIDAQVGGVSRFSVDNTGLMNAVGGVQVNGVNVLTTTNRGQANGVASLDSGGKVPAAQLPSSSGGGSGGGSLWECTDLGFKGWAYDPQTGTNAAQVQSATWYLSAVKIPQNCTVSNIHFWCTTAGASIVEFRAGIYSIDPTDTVEFSTTLGINRNFDPVALLGSSNNVTSIPTNVPVTFPLTAPVSLTAGVYQIAWYCNATTRPSMLRAYSQSNLSMGRTKQAYWNGWSPTEPIVFPANTAAFGTMSNQSQTFWTAVS